jgi:hypothetical protein
VTEARDLHVATAGGWLGLGYADALALFQSGDPVMAALRQKANREAFGFPLGLSAEALKK